VRHPKEIVQEGDTIEAAILSADPEQKRISLSLRKLSEDPWRKAAEAYAINTTLKRKVVRTTDFGAFVELEDGVDGLVHISELSDQHVKAVTDKVKAGDEVEVRVLGVDIENKRISLSMKQPAREPTPEELAKIEKDRQASRERRKRHDTRRGGLTFPWESGGLDALDPSKFAKR
jgi:ribosomal protein S1